MFRAKVVLPPIRLDIDAKRTAEECAFEMREFWMDQMEKGLQADGSPLPTNWEGKPMGRGTGKMLKRWRLRSSKKKPGLGQSIVEPYRGKEYRHVYWMLLTQKGVQFSSFKGASAKKWAEVEKRVVKDALDHALPTGKRKRRRRKIRAWQEPGSE